MPRNIPCPSLISSIKSSHALPKLLTSPSRLSPIILDISSAVPLVSFKASRNSKTSPAPFKNVLNAATERLSDSSKDFARSMPSASSCFKPATNSSKFLTGCPMLFAKSPLASARLSNMFRVAVAADEASKPAFANCPNNAKTSSRLKPKAFATGETMESAVSR